MESIAQHDNPSLITTILKRRVQLYPTVDNAGFDGQPDRVLSGSHIPDNSVKIRGLSRFPKGTE